MSRRLVTAAPPYPLAGEPDQLACGTRRRFDWDAQEAHEAIGETDIRHCESLIAFKVADIRQREPERQTVGRQPLRQRCFNLLSEVRPRGTPLRRHPT